MTVIDATPIDLTLPAVEEDSCLDDMELKFELNRRLARRVLMSIVNLPVEVSTSVHPEVAKILGDTLSLSRSVAELTEDEDAAYESHVEGLQAELGLVTNLSAF